MARSNLVAGVALAAALLAAPPAASRAQDAAVSGTTATDAGATSPAGQGTPSTTGDQAAGPTGTGETGTAGTGAMTSTTSPEVAAAPAEPSLSHRYQLGLRAGIGIPYMFGLQYKGNNPDCDPDPTHETWCRHFGVGTLDFDLGFGVSDSIELSFDARFGLANEKAAGSPPVSIGLGMRAYGSPEANVKVYFGPRLILDLTSSDTPYWNSADFGVRADVGLQVDFVRYVGMYGQLGLSLTFLRALMLVPDLSIGLQVRLP